MTRMALVGCGRVGCDVHLTLLGRHPDVEVVGVADPIAARRAAARAIVPAAATFDTWQALMDGVEADAVVVASPPATHRAVAVAALARGCHVYIEKPLAADPDEARAVVRAWRQSGRVAMVGFNYRFNPLIEEARRLLEQGAVGALVAVRTVLASPAGVHADWQSATSGGVLFELASHHLDLVPFLTSQPILRVSAAVRGTLTGADTAAISAVLADGTPVDVLVSRESATDDRVEVFGTAGRLVVDRYRSVRPRLTGRGVRTPLAEPVEWLRSAARAGHLVRKRRSPWHEPSYARALSAFLAGIGGAPCRPDPVDGCAVTDLVAAASASAASGCAVAIRTLEGVSA
jgi:myo-inositol 2-dehydrogenase / D-chiro-inositol 1-dehydrogenase